MATVVVKQVETYHDSVMKASNIAIKCWDAHPLFQELILMAPGLVEGVRAVVGAPIKSDTERQQLIAAGKDLLSGFNLLLKGCKTLREHDFTLTGLAEFQEAIKHLRFIIVDLIDGSTGGAKSSTETAAATDAETMESFATRAQEMPPAPSWYKEDFGAVRGSIVE